MPRRSLSVVLCVLVAGLAAAVAGCGSDEDPAPAARGGSLDGRWLVTRYASGGSLTEPPAGVVIDAAFLSGTVSGTSGVNGYTGPYTATPEGDIEVGEVVSTQMAGPPAAMEAERAYLDALRSAASYRSEAGVLTLYDGDGAPAVVYGADERGLTGAWEVTGFNNGREAVVSVAAGSTITARFGPDGTLTGDAGVNTYRTTFEESDGADGAVRVSIPPAATTRRAGPPELMEQERLYLEALASAVEVTFQGDRATFRDARDAIAVTMERRPAGEGAAGSATEPPDGDTP